MAIEHSIWVEKYRPATLDDYITDKVTRAKIREYIDKQDIPHILLYGNAGCGKTSLSQILVKNIDCDFMMINASDERGIDTIRDKVKGFAVTMGFKPLKIIVLDECDGLPGDSQRALRNIIESYSSNTRFILTANYIERIIDPLVSRCQTFKLTPPSKKEVAVALVNILTQENVEYDTKTVVQIVKTHYPDIRKIIGTAQLQTNDSVLSVSAEELVGQDVKLKVIDILTDSSITLTNKITDIRQLVADNQVRDFAGLYRTLYDTVDKYASDKIPQAIIAIADGQYRSEFVVDKEITFAATLYTILTT